MKDLLLFAPEVSAALREGRPVVALESTLITHGLPWPENFSTASLLEETVRENGAVPATIAILNGRPCIGLDASQLESLAKNRTAEKCSRRNLPLVIAQQKTGATTVAGTMYLAHLAGIEVFATGGIGGVHRGAPYDISADLTELSRTPVTVVCAGAKAILDIPLTLEFLETQGVPVVGFRTSDFPAFYSRSSGLPVDTRCDGPEEIADIIRARRSIGLETGMLVANPVPEDHELPREEAEPAILSALKELVEKGITGKEVTPFLLARVSTLTGERSKTANIALLKNNARVAALIAVALVG